MNLHSSSGSLPKHAADNNREHLLISTRNKKRHSGKESACNAGDAKDASPVPGFWRSHEVGNGNPLQYSCLENSMDRAAYGVTKSRVQLSTHVCATVYMEIWWCFLTVEFSSFILLYWYKVAFFFFFFWTAVFNLPNTSNSDVAQFWAEWFMWCDKHQGTNCYEQEENVAFLFQGDTPRYCLLYIKVLKG